MAPLLHRAAIISESLCIAVVYNSTEAFWLVYFPSYILQKIIIAQMLSIGGEGKIVYWPRHHLSILYTTLSTYASHHTRKAPNSLRIRTKTALFLPPWNSLCI